MRPQPDDLDDFDVRQDLINKPMLDVDPAGIGTGQVADELFEGRRILKGILAQNSQQGFRLGPEPRGREFLGVFLGLFGINQPPNHQRSLEDSFPTGVLSPFRMDSRMPGTDSR